MRLAATGVWLSLDAIEKAIRNAFEKGDPEDRAFREKVYRSAFAALDRALKTHTNLTVEAAIIRRKSLQAKIAEIETEFMPAIRAARAAQPPPQAQTPQLAEPRQPPPRPVPIPEPEMQPQEEASYEVEAPEAVEAIQPPPQAAPPSVPQMVEPAPRSAPELDPQSAPSVSVDRVGEAAPSLDAGYVPGVSMADERPVQAGSLAGDPRPAEIAIGGSDVRPPRKRSRWAMFFLIVTLLTAAAIGAWWASKTGLFKSPEEIDTSVPNPPNATEEEDFVPVVPEEPADEAENDGGGVGNPARPGEIDEQRNWITVFTPEDPSLANAPSDASAEVADDDFGSFLRIRSGAAGSAVVFDVGQGVLEQIAGKKVVFEIVARAEDGKPTQMSVTCDLGALGDCGRKRYDVVAERAEYLWELTLPAARPGDGGTISVVSDLENQGKAVQIYEIRTAISQ